MGVCIICGEDSGANAMKKIWLVNHYAMPPELEPRLRTIKFAEYLTKADTMSQFLQAQCITWI